MNIKRETRLYSLVVIDISNHCNHRCRFCYNRWAEEHSMPMETFQKILQLLPYTKDGGFSLSCLYEPTQNPRFFEMARQIPRQFKNKVVVTTNLDGPYTNDELENLAKSHIHHVTVSLPSFDERLYRHISRTESGPFYENLTRLRQAIDDNPNRTRLQLDSMVLKSNYAEMGKLVMRAHDELRPYAHHINTPQLFAEGENVLLQGAKDNREVEKELCTTEELSRLQDELEGLGYKNLIYSMQHSKEAYTAKIKGNGPATVAHDAYSIYISATGEGFFMKDKNPFDLADIDHPFVFFSKALMARQAHQAVMNEVKAPAEICDHSEDPDFHCTLDTITIWDERFVQLEGWAFHKQAKNGPLFIMVQAEGQRVIYKTTPVFREDVREMLDGEDPTNVGFDCLVDPRVLPYTLGQKYEVHLGLLQGDVLVTRYLTDLLF